MIRGRGLAAALAVLAVNIGGCSKASQESTLTASESDRADSSQSTAAPTATIGGAEQTEELLLARQVRYAEFGEGYLSCRLDESLPTSFATSPAVWINTGLSEPLELTLSGVYEHAELCLRGFSADRPIVVTLEAQGFRARTTVLPTNDTGNESSHFASSMSPYTLFQDGESIWVSPAMADHDNDGYMEEVRDTLASRWWDLIPPANAREAIAATQSITIEATQGDISARVEQQVSMAGSPGFAMVAPLPIGDVRLLVWGYPEGASVPIGLYSDNGAHALDLVETIGTVVMPSSRVAEFEVPPGLLENRSPEFYCVLPPVEEGSVALCEQVWPDYPGRASPGDRGDVVRRWQDILTIDQIIQDTPENRDGYYGPLMTQKVMDRQDSAGLLPDGVLGFEFYAEITHSVLPD